jgi:exportin-2 (importin alpha re-exporter)
VRFLRPSRENRQVDGEPNKISEQDRVTVKQHIVDLMLSMPAKLQRQLSEAVCIMAGVQ